MGRMWMLLAAALCACADQGGARTEGETHWLAACGSDVECGSLYCLCDRCTVPCQSGSDCAGLGSGAVCLPAACGAASVCAAASDAPDAQGGDAGATDVGSTVGDTPESGDAPGPGDVAVEPDVPDSFVPELDAAALLPFGAPCAEAAECSGALPLCIQTGAGRRCSRQCNSAAQCHDGWRCVYCDKECSFGDTWFMCVPPEDASDIVACEPQAGGFVKLNGLPTTLDRHIVDAPCQLTVTDVDLRRFAVDCPGTLDTPVELELFGNAAVLTPPLLAEPAVRMTWLVEDGMDLTGPWVFVLTDADEDRVLLADAHGELSHPVPFGASPDLYAPLTFEVFDTDCAVIETECNVRLPLAMRASLGDKTAMLFADSLVELGDGPTWQLHSGGASRLLTVPACTDVSTRSLSLQIVRLTDE